MILKKTVEGDTITYQEVGENTLLANMIDGLKAPVLADDEFLSSGAAFWGTAIYTIGSSAASSMVARNRQKNGQPPMLKVFF